MKYSIVIKRIICLSLIVVFFMCFNKVYAHEAMLDVDYDNCVDSTSDGIDEMWYSLNSNTSCNHISHSMTTIKYYFEDKSKDGTYSWNTDVSDTTSSNIKKPL